MFDDTCEKLPQHYRGHVAQLNFLEKYDTESWTLTIQCMTLVRSLQHYLGHVAQSRI